MGGKRSSEEKSVNVSAYEGWDDAYRDVSYAELPWEAGIAPKELTTLVTQGSVKKGAALDICCGAGTSALYLAEQGFKVSGIDISSEAVDIALKRATEAGLSIDLQVGNAVHLPFPDESFDFVYDRGCFHHILARDRNTFIRGIHRVLRPGGKYQLFCFSSRERWATNRFSPDDIVRLFSRLFKIEKMEETTHREPGGALRYFLSVLMEKQ